jgi:hypothetical protein
MLEYYHEGNQQLSMLFCSLRAMPTLLTSSSLKWCLHCGINRSKPAFLTIENIFFVLQNALA